MQKMEEFCSYRKILPPSGQLQANFTEGNPSAHLTPLQQILYPSKTDKIQSVVHNAFRKYINKVTPIANGNRKIPSP